MPSNITKVTKLQKYMVINKKNSERLNGKGYILWPLKLLYIQNLESFSINY